MSSSGSITHWLVLLKAGDSAAAQPLWERYYRRLVALARTKLQGVPRLAADEEDVALSAFGSFCRAAEQGRFPRLDDRDDLTHILLMLTARKALSLRQHQTRQKRGGGRVVSLTDLEAEGGDEVDGLMRVIGPEPTPEFAAQMEEEYQRLLGLLGNDLLRKMAVAKMEGYTIEEMAARFDCAPCTVVRKLQKIRETWDRELPS
jgi:DNA-directed RNA polymerase specialized sigma24 family protein